MDFGKGKGSVQAMSTIPTEIISKIMLFHSNIRFDKNELVKFVTEWKIVKDLLDDEDAWDEDPGDKIIKDITHNNLLVRRFYFSYTGCEYEPPDDEDYNYYEIGADGNITTENSFNQPKPKCCADCFVITNNPNWEETAQCVECELNDENEIEDQLTMSMFDK